MNKLERSIRHEMKWYGPRLRTGHYGALGNTVGVIPDDFGTIDGVFCDIDNGAVTDIRLYCVGDAKEPRDYHGRSVEITSAVTDYLSEHHDWNEMIHAMVDIITSDSGK